MRPTPDSITLHFKKQFDYKAGQHAALTFTIHGVEHSRTYSFNTSPYSDAEAAITVRAIPGGIVSNFLVREAAPDLAVQMSGVLGDFFVEPSDKKRHLIMFAGGSGITPIMSMLKTVLEKEPESCITLVYSNRKIETIIFKDELEALADQVEGRLKIYHCISESAETNDNFPIFFKGQLNRLVVRKLVKSLLEKNDPRPEFYLCGPHGFMTMIEEALKALSIDAAQIFRENFFVPNQNSPEKDFSRLPAREVTVQWLGEDTRLQVASGKSILEAALENGLNLPHSCREGQCGVCRSQLIRGEVKLRKNSILTEAELEASQVLLCQGYPVTDDVVVRPLNGGKIM